MMVERNGRSGRGPSQRSQSRPGGGGESGAWPIPPGAMLLVNAARATVTLPSAPDCTDSASCAYIRDERRCVPTCTIRSCFRAASTIARPSTIVIDSGFSTYTSLPARQAAIIWIACQWSGVAITTASMSLRSSTARKSLTRATSPSIVGIWAIRLPSPANRGSIRS